MQRLLKEEYQTSLHSLAQVSSLTELNHMKGRLYILSYLMGDDFIRWSLGETVDNSPGELDYMQRVPNG